MTQTSATPPSPAAQPPTSTPSISTPSISTPVRRAQLATIAQSGPAVLLAVVVLAAWQTYTHTADISPTVLPSPWRIVRTLGRNVPLLWRHSKTTLLETTLGFGLAMLTAAVLALLIDMSDWLARALYPWLIASQTIPIVALAPLMLVWFGFGLLPKVLLVALFCFFPMVVAAVDGLGSTDPALQKLLQSMGAGYWQMLWWVRLPAALPSIFSGLKIAITYSVTAAIFAEYAGGMSGLGILMQTSAQSRATPLVFAGIVVTSFASFGLFALVSLLERSVVTWQDDT